jgi:hypothetical protein
VLNLITDSSSRDLVNITELDFSTRNKGGRLDSKDDEDCMTEKWNRARRPRRAPVIKKAIEVVIHSNNQNGNIF